MLGILVFLSKKIGQDWLSLDQMKAWLSKFGDILPPIIED
jgi:hypothetical protein